MQQAGKQRQQPGLGRRRCLLLALQVCVPCVAEARRKFSKLTRQRVDWQASVRSEQCCCRGGAAAQRATKAVRQWRGGGAGTGARLLERLLGTRELPHPCAAVSRLQRLARARRRAQGPRPAHTSRHGSRASAHGSGRGTEARERGKRHHLVVLGLERLLELVNLSQSDSHPAQAVPCRQQQHAPLAPPHTKRRTERHTTVAPTCVATR